MRSSLQMENFMSDRKTLLLHEQIWEDVRKKMRICRRVKDKNDDVLSRRLSPIFDFNARMSV